MAGSCLQQRKKIHELVQRKEREEYHELPGQEELVEHQHSQQMGHTVSEGAIQGETGEPRIDGSLKGMVARSGKNIWRRKMQREMMIMVVECILGEKDN